MGNDRTRDSDADHDRNGPPVPMKPNTPLRKHLSSREHARALIARQTASAPHFCDLVDQRTPNTRNLTPQARHAGVEPVARDDTT